MEMFCINLLHWTALIFNAHFEVRLTIDTSPSIDLINFVLGIERGKESGSQLNGFTCYSEH